MYKSQLPYFIKSSLLLVCFGIVFSEAFAVSDAQVKQAGVLYNLSKFIDWPAHSSEKFNICLLGEVIFLDELKAFEQRQIRGRPVRIMILQNLANAADIQALSNCQTLYVSSSIKESLPLILAVLDKKPILTISDLPNFVLQGGMIGLIQVKKRVRFTINLDATKSVNLVISAQLLRLAKSIKYKDSQIDNPE